MKKVNYYKFLLLYIKVSKEISYQKHRDVILKRAKGYYKNGKERLRKLAKNEYGEYGRNEYLNMSKEIKQKLKEYQQKYREAKKYQFSDQ